MGSKLESFLTRADSQEPATPATTDTGTEPVTDEKSDAAPGTEPAAMASATSAEKADDKSKDAPKAETPDDADPDETVARVRDENGRFKPLSESEKGLIATVKKLREENRGLKTQQKPPARETPQPKKRTSFYEDADRAGQELEQSVAAQIAQQRYNQSEAAAMDRHKDFAAVVTPFLTECEDDPVLTAQVFEICNRHADPAEAFYQYAQRHATLKQYDGDLGKFRTSIEEPLTKRIKELEGQVAQLTKKREELDGIPSTLSTVPNDAPTGTEKAEGSKRSLGSIVGERREQRRKRA